MEPRKEVPGKEEPRKVEGRKPRFRLVKLEERVVPAQLFTALQYRPSGTPTVSSYQSC